ncbi:hypothetical protein THAOC_35955, partial [Thalassiosira oceanica]
LLIPPEEFPRNSFAFLPLGLQGRAFFFLTALLAIISYHTNKTRLAEAPFGPVGDDNGPGSEPPPHDRLRYVNQDVHAEPPPASGGRRKAELSSFQGLLST